MADTSNGLNQLRALRMHVRVMVTWSITKLMLMA